MVAPFALMAALSLALGMQTPAGISAGTQVVAELPAVSPSSAATPSATPSPTSTPTVTPSPTPPPAPQPPPDPLAGLSKKEHKAFSACLKRQVGAHSSGTCATLAISRLKKAGFYHWPASSGIGVAGANALLNYQRSRGLTPTATTTRQTWIALATKAKAVDATLPAKCLGSGVNLCVNQGQRKLYFLRDGKVVRTFKVRLGGYNYHPKTHKWRVFPTANGSWRVFDKQVNPKSDNYGSGAMPYSVMFHPDMYVHYSPGFHADGYAKSSHGCVNIGQLSEAIWIYKHTPVGARVTVFTPKSAA
ncbi:L,D-transpeptidase [Propionicimonas paludicola]|nr:L,D-transpeptidase [Propionicimonas paludicola]